MSECIGDGGTCGLGGYCKECPHVKDQELVEKITELKHLAENYAHVYSFVGDDSMPIAQEKLYKAIDNFASLCRQHEWIPVSKRLPEDLDMGLIVYYENKCANAVCSTDVYFESKGFCRKQDGDFLPIVGVTHWMPLPKPPIANLRGSDE